MWAALLEQISGARLPLPVVIALIIIVAASALALIISLRVARRIRAIGDAGDAQSGADEEQRHDGAA
jgi:hypothetical protein